MLKVEPHADYPPEEGRYLRGNDYSPVAVVVILIYNNDCWQSTNPACSAPDPELLIPGTEGDWAFA